MQAQLGYLSPAAFERQFYEKNWRSDPARIHYWQPTSVMSFLPVLEFISVRLPKILQIKLPGHAGRHATENAGIRRKRKRHVGQLIDLHSGGDGDRRHLRDLDRPFADDVATENLVR
jgi:hypothetical protein